MQRQLLTALIMLFSFGCGAGKKHPEKITVNQAMLDSVRAKSDTSYTKKYRNLDFVTADYIVNRKDSTVCQVMKDSTGMIRQVIIARKEVRMFTAEYYPNGQLQAALILDEHGLYDGPATYYFENGNPQRTGKFVHGFLSGDWKNYDNNGRLISKDIYDDNGQLIKTIKAS
jgi:hypothetical protein